VQTNNRHTPIQRPDSDTAEHPQTRGIYAFAERAMKALGERCFNPFMPAPTPVPPPIIIPACKQAKTLGKDPQTYKNKVQMFVKVLTQKALYQIIQGLRQQAPMLGATRRQPHPAQHCKG
jgi:hypothetical protein